MQGTGCDLSVPLDADSKSDTVVRNKMIRTAADISKSGLLAVLVPARRPLQKISALVAQFTADEVSRHALIHVTIAYSREIETFGRELLT
jgi:hypothetical protein